MTTESDFLVIGSGIAGLSVALKLAQHGSVAIITKKEEAESNTNYAQGGIAAVIAKDDSFEIHISDTLKAGAGLCNKDAVNTLVQQGPNRVNELVKWGTEFSRKTDSTRNGFDLGREGGHSKNRIVHARDLTGREVENSLLDAIKAHPEIRIYEEHCAIELITEHHIRRKSLPSSADTVHCWGAYVLDTASGSIKMFLSKYTILATGGCGQVYLHTTNPKIATGDGIAMAFRAGARIANLEFMQFHPTTLFHQKADSFLISEAVRGFGGVLKTKDGAKFMENYHSMGSLAPRDIVARAIDAELKKRGENCVYLDITHLDADALIDRFPHIYAKCLSYNIDITKQPIPVVPAAHYMCGGVETDINGRTNIANLYACGEVACTGVHGANRLASNSLLEAVVFSHQIYRNILDQKDRISTVHFPEIQAWDDSGTFNQEEWILIQHDKEEIQSLMWDYVGIVRSNLRLQRAQRRVNLICNEIEKFYKKTKITEGLLELRNLAFTAKLIINCALHRKESRGLHYTTDYPETDDENWQKDTVVYRRNKNHKILIIQD
ncbi:L-aspartate oxidase [candidate division KSB1 bacterium]|nr:L-aspartate oxidase [candidate division KSB1 bacterium]